MLLLHERGNSCGLCGTKCCDKHSHNAAQTTPVGHGAVLVTQFKRCHNCKTIYVLAKPSGAYYASWIVGMGCCIATLGLGFPLYVPCCLVSRHLEKQTTSRIAAHSYEIHEGDEIRTGFVEGMGMLARPRQLVMRAGGNNTVSAPTRANELPQL